MTEPRTADGHDDELDRLLRSTTGAIACSTAPPPELEELEAFASLRDHEEDRMRNRWGTGMIAVAAGLVVAVVVGVLAVASTSDDNVADEQSSGENGGAAAENITIAERTATALFEGDQNVIDRLVTDDAHIDAFGYTTAADLAKAGRTGPVGYQFDLQSCSYDPDVLAGWGSSCAFSMSTAWSRELGAAPTIAELQFRIEDGNVTGVRLSWDSVRSSTLPFQYFVQRQSIDDAMRMFGDGPLGWVWDHYDQLPADERAAVDALFERYIDEYVAAESAS